MDLNDLKPVLDLMTLQEERFVKKIDEVHEDVIDTRNELRKLNGTVRTHQTIIDKNLPHTIAQCSQASTIDEIKKAVVGEDAIKGYKKRVKDDKHSMNIMKIMLTGIIISAIIGLFSVSLGFINMERNKHMTEQNTTIGEKVDKNTKTITQMDSLIKQ